MTPTPDPESSRLRLASRIWIGLGAAGSILHAAPGFHPSHGLWGTFDTTELSYLVFTAIGFLVPLIEDFRLAGMGFSIKKRKIEEFEIKAKKQSDDYLSVLEQSSRFLADESSALGKLSNAIRGAGRDVEIGFLTALYCNRRMQELVRFLNLPEDVIRAAVWLYSEDVTGLYFFASNEIVGREAKQYMFDRTTKEHVFTRGRGLVSQCYEENTSLDFADAPVEPAFEKIDGAEESRFHGLLLVPIRDGDSPIGVLALDKQTRGRFGEDAARVAQTIANYIGVAVLQARERNAYLMLPERHRPAKELPPGGAGYRDVDDPDRDDPRPGS